MLSWRMVRLGLVGLVLGVGVACGGMSLDESNGGGKGGSAGTTGGTGGSTGGSNATGGKGGSTGGSNATGGKGGSTGGSGAMGGTGPVTGGTGGSTGGVAGTVSVTGGTGGSTIGGTSGMAGSPCSLPIESGPCDAAFYAFAFDTATRHCRAFVYGGCEGNANRFTSLEACQAACGGGNPDCPATLPGDSVMCLTMTTCQYDAFSGCLCLEASGYPCTYADPECPRPAKSEIPGSAGACSGDECTAEIVLPENTQCTCDGFWQCGPTLLE